MAHSTEANLFEVGDFISHAGNKLAWKIECDAIRPGWWDGLARMIMDYQTEPFSKVVGIPRGGLPLQYAMEQYVTPGDHPWMVEIGRAHVRTPVTEKSRMPSSA